MQVTFCRTDGNGLFLFVISDFYACQTDDAFVSQLCFLEQQVFYRRFVFELAFEEGFGQKSFKQFEQLVFLPAAGGLLVFISEGMSDPRIKPVDDPLPEMSPLEFVVHITRRHDDVCGTASARCRNVAGNADAVVVQSFPDGAYPRGFGQGKHTESDVVAGRKVLKADVFADDKVAAVKFVPDGGVGKKERSGIRQGKRFRRRQPVDDKGVFHQRLFSVNV